MIRTVKNAIKILLYHVTSKRQWYEDLCEYYKVTPEKAKELGNRTGIRRPDLPGSPTTHTVSGKTLDEIWEMEERDTVEKVLKWQKDQGAWSSFRQLYYHRYDRFGWVIKGLPTGGKYCEYACGTAPVSNWIVENIKDRVFDITTVDVDCEHRTFGEWRLKKRIERSGLPFKLKTYIVKPDHLPLEDEYDIISIFEALVLIHNPLNVIKHITEDLKKGGKLWETYTILDDYRTKNYLSFRQAQEQRPAVFDYIRSKYKLLSGPDPDTVKDSGIRSWLKI